MLRLISAPSPIAPFIFLSYHSSFSLDSRFLIKRKVFYLVYYIDFSNLRDTLFLKMGIKEIRTALKVDLNKHAREQPGLHVCLSSI